MNALRFSASNFRNQKPETKNQKLVTIDKYEINK